MITDETLANLPEGPGVYLFRDTSNQIIYVGKAKNIRDRVGSYFDESTKEGRLGRLLSRIESVSFVLTGNEKEAFLLENNLIKEHQPKYNVVLKDDKTYISLRLSVKEKFPALSATRNIRDDGALYFGPHPHARDVRDFLKIVQSLYPVRRCKDAVFKGRVRPCILYDIGKCLAPCVGYTDEASYRAIVDELTDFLSGKDEKLLKSLEEQIDTAAKAWDFEGAREKRERYHVLKRLVEKQHVHEHLGKNRDVWAVLREERKLRIVLLSFRRGVFISKRNFHEPFSLNPDGAFSSFIFQYYASRQIPDEIILSETLEDLPLLEMHLRERRPGLRILGPESRGAGDMITLAVENLHEVEPIETDEAFRRTLRLRKAPKRIEVYDISHTGGTNPSGIMVVFDNFKPRKDTYRVFHIREAKPEDDVAMMSEVLTRRMRDEKIRPLPDLVILDGGKGQLSAAINVFKTLSVSPDLLGIAKGLGRKRMEDVLYLPFRKNPLLLPKSSPVFKEIVRMRDEAHRFAIGSHKKWKRREDLSSILPNIKGVGKKRMMRLLKEFPSLDAMREADADQIASLPGFNRKIAEEIKAALTHNGQA
ncbi:MAG: excinuclease ABC subunit UvrC [Syntrophorhabdales bacterium]